jgi:prephenate dehydratase/prephenate dehydrogenase
VTDTDDPIKSLAVVGAARGMGRWLTENLFAYREWDEVVLLDLSDEIHRREFPGGGVVRTGTVRYGDAFTAVDADGAALDLSSKPMHICLAVPQVQLETVANTLLPLLHPDSTVFDTCPSKEAASSVLGAARADLAAYGIHALFIPVGSLAGATIVICPSSVRPHAHEWLKRLVGDTGGLVEEASAAEHDRVMTYVQSASHQALMTFADVIANSGLDVEHTLWRYRTPLFETLLGLAARALNPDRDEEIATIQELTGGMRTAQQFADAMTRLSDVIDAGSISAVQSHIGAIRDTFGGTFFTTLQQGADRVVETTQATRAVLATHRRDGRLTALARAGAGEDAKIVVGRIAELTATTVTIEDLVRGPRGDAALLWGAGEKNAVKLGKPVGRRRLVTLGLAHVRPIGEAELDRELDAWLARLSGDVRLLVPESIAGGAVVAVCAAAPSVDGAELVSETVRVGQREVVVRIAVRADRDPHAVADGVARLIEEVYAWPAGRVSRLVSAEAPAIAYLGPRGTFSETAAGQAAEITGFADAELVERATTDEVLGAVRSGDATLAVLPIANSSSGLVEPAARGLLDAGDLVAGGVIDVSVRFDAYASADAEQPEGAVPIYSHSQALAQCSHFVERMGGSAIACDSTAAACTIVADRRAGIALVAQGQGVLYGLVLLERDVGDLAGVVTRFLVVGRPRTFVEGDAPDDPTYRSLWLLRGGAAAAASLAGPRFDETIVGPSGIALVVSTHDEPAPRHDALPLGRIPWSPRTPIVRVK